MNRRSSNVGIPFLSMAEKLGITINLPPVDARPAGTDDEARSPSADADPLLMATKYIRLILRQGGFTDRHMAAQASQTLLGIISTAASTDGQGGDRPAEGGRRAARLEAILEAIAEGFADPAFAIRSVAEKLGLSERYIQEVLHATGAGFGERVMERRLQQSVSLLAGAEATRRKVSDVALASGFNDLSYFHRCFRRRFGTTPAGARAG